MLSMAIQTILNWLSRSNFWSFHISRDFRQHPDN